MPAKNTVAAGGGSFPFVFLGATAYAYVTTSAFVGLKGAAAAVCVGIATSFGVALAQCLVLLVAFWLVA